RDDLVTGVQTCALPISACGILRCSPVWCICDHKELSQGWTSNNKKLDEFITKTQRQTNSPNEAYLEWIPFDHMSHDYDDAYYLQIGRASCRERVMNYVL